MANQQYEIDQLYKYYVGSFTSMTLQWTHGEDLVDENLDELLWLLNGFREVLIEVLLRAQVSFQWESNHKLVAAWW